MKLREFAFFWNLWPPFLGLGLAIKKIAPDFRSVRVVLKKRPWNVNYFGSQYGGGIFAMTDGIHMLMLIRNLPRKYRIWDKAANIIYLKRGHTQLYADLNITEEDLVYIQNTVTEDLPLDWVANVEIKDEHGQIVAKVERTLSIKLAKKEASTF